MREKKLKQNPTVSAFKIALMWLFDAMFPMTITMLYCIVCAFGLHREIDSESVYDWQLSHLSL